MDRIILTGPEDKYLRSYWETFDAVAKEKRYLASTERFPFESSVAFYRNLISKGLPRVFAVDTRTDRCIGWCDINAKSETEGTVGTGLLKEYRNCGIGTLMLTEALRQAGKDGFERVELEVLESNARAIHLYTKLGFVLQGRREKPLIWKHSGISENVLRMRKELKEKKK